MSLLIYLLWLSSPVIAQIGIPIDLPKLTTTTDSASGSASRPTYPPPQPPPYLGGWRSDFQLQCTDRNMLGIKTMDRRIATDAITLRCGSPLIVSPVDKFNI